MSQRFNLKFVLAVAGIAACAMFGGRVSAQDSSPTNSLPNPYHLVDGWGKELPRGRCNGGSTNAIDVDAKGNVWVAERCGGNSCVDSPLDPILEFDAAGKFGQELLGGGMFVTPHGLYVDKEGNIWGGGLRGKR